MDDSEAPFTRSVSAKSKRKLAAQRDGTRPAWFGLGTLGVVGWSVVVPTLLGALAGSWIDRHWAPKHSWTLALLIAGLCLGCVNAWIWITRQHALITGSPTETDK